MSRCWTCCPTSGPWPRSKPSASPQLVHRQRTALQEFTRGLLASFFVLVLWGGAHSHAGDAPPDLEVFLRAGCPHCEAAKILLSQLQRERPSLRIALNDIAEDSAARQRP